MAKDAFGFGDTDAPGAFVQWKGTDVCMDFYCDCGAHGHFDGFFAYTVKCQHCGTTWEMPVHLFPRKACGATDAYWRDNPQLLEPDEDHSTQAVGLDGISHLVPHPVANKELP